MNKNLHDLFIEQLQIAHSAESQLLRALPWWARAAISPDLAALFQQHLEKTRIHLERLEAVCEQVGCETGVVIGDAMEGLIAETEEILDMGLDAATQDAGLIATAQKIIHYEIAVYGTLCTFANQLGHADIAAILHETLLEEKDSDRSMTEIAVSGINEEAGT